MYFSELIDYVLSLFGDFIDTLSSMYLFRGVSILGVLLAVMIVIMVIGFVFRK
ncbi:MAG: hypothetical protein NC223_11570 [Butyrivibrio sp.]|nr:hypothetical protein [Butyrivibrio sp.]